jgi:prevent-host-death family protein
MEVNIHQAKTHLSQLLEKVAMGEEVIIAKAGRPIAKIVPLAKTARKRCARRRQGRFRCAEGFQRTLAERDRR